MHRTSPIFALILCVAGCGGGAQTNPPMASHTTAIAYVSSWDFGASPKVGPTPLVLFDQQFVDPNASGYLLALSVGAPLPQNTQVTWTSSNPAALPLEQQQPFSANTPAFPAPTAPPNETYVQTGKAYGTSTISATVGEPATLPSSITAYHYPSLSFGCRFRSEPVFAFDPDRVALMENSANWTSADLYDTFPSNDLGPLDPCLNTLLASAPGTAEIWHVPYGGVLLPATTLQGFVRISASQWKNASTAFAAGNMPGFLLFKTKEGRIVKAFVPTGPYESSDLSGKFPY